MRELLNLNLTFMNAYFSKMIRYLNALVLSAKNFEEKVKLCNTNCMKLVEIKYFGKKLNRAIKVEKKLINSLVVDLLYKCYIYRNT